MFLRKTINYGHMDLWSSGLSLCTQWAMHYVHATYATGLHARVCTTHSHGPSVHCIGHRLCHTTCATYGPAAGLCTYGPTGLRYKIRISRYRPPEWPHDVIRVPRPNGHSTTHTTCVICLLALWAMWHMQAYIGQQVGLFK